MLFILLHPPINGWYHEFKGVLEEEEEEENL